MNWTCPYPAERCTVGKCPTHTKPGEVAGAHPMDEERAAAIAACWRRDQAEDLLHAVIAQRADPMKRGDPRHLLGVCENLLHEWSMNTGPVCWPHRGHRVEVAPDDLDAVVEAFRDDFDDVMKIPGPPRGDLDRRVAMLVLELRSARAALRAIAEVVGRNARPPEPEGP